MKLYRKTDLAEIIGVSENTIDRMVKAGSFPSPLRVGKRAVAWPEADVQEWLDARAVERDREREAG